MKQKTNIVTLSKSGKGEITTKLSIPWSWLQEMGITEKEREVLLKFDGEQIIITNQKGGEKMESKYEAWKSEGEKIRKELGNISSGRIYSLKEAIKRNDFNYVLDELLRLYLESKIGVFENFTELLERDEEAKIKVLAMISGLMEEGK